MHITYRGDVTSPSGYSRAVRNHMRALIEIGVDIDGDQHKHDTLEVALDPFWRTHITQVLARSGAAPRIKIWHETPEFYDPQPQNYNIGFVVWETSKIPDDDRDGNPRLNWVRQMNRMDEIWTASEFCKRVFVACGIKVPISVFPHPIDLESYSAVGEVPGFTGLTGNPIQGLNFISVFQWTRRKNPTDMIVAFTAEFSHNSEVSLFVKTYGSDFTKNDEIIQSIKLVRQNMGLRNLVRNVHPVLELIPDEEMPAFYRSGSAYLGTPFGEGFGMPFQEAMACGLPCIFPIGTAMDDFIDGDCGYPVETDAEPVRGMGHIPWYRGDQDWYKVRIPHLRAAMRQTYKDWKSGKLEEKGKVARASIEEKHSFNTVGRAMLERLSHIEGRVGVVAGA